MKNKTLFILAVQYIPVLMAFGLWLHEVLMLLGIHLKVAQNIMSLDVIPALLLLIVSHHFKFCALHKSLLLYTLFVSLCIWYNESFGFNLYERGCRIGVVVVGVGIFVYYLCHIKRFYKNCCP